VEYSLSTTYGSDYDSCLKRLEHHNKLTSCRHNSEVLGHYREVTIVQINDVLPPPGIGGYLKYVTVC